MKKTLMLFCFCCYSIGGIAQRAVSSKDSISQFYSTLISVMKSDYLYKEDVDWKHLESQLNDKLSHYDNFKESLKEVTTLFDKSGADHSSVYFNGNSIAASYNGPAIDDFSKEWIKKYNEQPSFEVKVIQDDYGYILIPSMNFEDISSKNIHEISQPLYDQIAEIKKSKEIKGWIIDLRFNTGGNSWPMLLSLYDLLGDNAIYGMPCSTHKCNRPS